MRDLPPDANGADIEYYMVQLDAHLASYEQTHSDEDRMATGFYVNQIGVVHRMLLERLSKRIAEAIASGMFDPDRS